METIRKLVLGASSSHIKHFIQAHRLELRVIAFAALLGTLLISVKPSFISMKDLAVINAFRSYTQPTSVLLPSERINLEELVSKTMSYSYEETELGFYLKDLEFFENFTKAQAETKILKSLPYFLKSRAQNYVRAVLILAEKHQVDPIWVLSVMWTESNFDYSAKSWAGARGLMQIMPETRKFVYREYKRRGNRLMVEEPNFNVNRFFPYPINRAGKTRHVRKLVNIELGIIYLKSLLQTFKDHKFATVAYNMGPGWTLMRLRKNLPVGEKNNYLDKVQSAYKQIVKKI